MGDRGQSGVANLQTDTSNVPYTLQKCISVNSERQSLNLGNMIDKRVHMSPPGTLCAEKPLWCQAPQDYKHCHCHTPAGWWGRRRRGRCSACSAGWPRWHQLCHQSWSDWRHSGVGESRLLIQMLFISLCLGTSFSHKAANSTSTNVLLTKISMVPLEIFVVIPRAWKKEVFSGPRPVFWAGTLTSQGAMAPARAAAGTWSIETNSLVH